MIGGNGYLNGFLNGTEYPPRELCSSGWLQANVFMPSILFSFVPWDYPDAVTIQVSRNLVKLHAQIASTIVRLMQKSVKTGAPLNPPIWWVDQFLLGEEILVAPVIEEDAISRDIYLPRGTWLDANTNVTHTGPLWLRSYPAPLDILPYFYRLSDNRTAPAAHISTTINGDYEILETNYFKVLFHSQSDILLRLSLGIFCIRRDACSQFFISNK